MSDPSTWSPIPTPHDERTGLQILDRAKLILAPMLPGCTARRYDFPRVNDYSPVELCFADRGPIVPKLILAGGKYYGSTGANVYYDSMLRDAKNLGTAFFGGKIPVSARLDSGPEAMALTLRQAIFKVDFSEMIAAGSVERVLAEYARYPEPWTNLHLALCAVYLGRNEEARALLRDALRYAEEDGRPGYEGLIAEIETDLAKFEADADALRQELTATMESNWSHLKIVDA